MGGVTLSARLDDEAMRAAFGRVVGLMATPAPMLKQIGAGLVSAVQEHFQTQTDPWGRAWKPLNPAYAAFKRNTHILTESHHLVDSINFLLGAREVSVGSNLVYARIHLLGGKIVAKGKPLTFPLAGGKGGRVFLIHAHSVFIPARPYLGLGAGEMEAIALAVRLHVRRALRG